MSESESHVEVNSLKLGSVDSSRTRPETMNEWFNYYDGVQQGDMYPNEPVSFTEHHLNDLLWFCALQNVSDVKILTGHPVIVKASGKNYAITEKSLNNDEVRKLINQFYGGSNAQAKLGSGQPIDIPYQVRPDRFLRFRFRVSITSQRYRGGDGYRITARLLPPLPSLPEELGIEQEIIDNFTPRTGAVIVTGATGSGKSTLLASMIRRLLEEKDGHHDILTFESPVEFDYHDVNRDPSNIISQCEIPVDLQNFSESIRNALRNSPDYVLIGEARDDETMAGVVKAAVTGHGVMTTLHTNGAVSTIKRMVLDASKSKSFTVSNVIDALRLVVSQILLPNPNGGRTAIREWIVFSKEDRERLIDTPVERISNVAEEILASHGTSFAKSAKKALDRGLIFQHDYDNLIKEGV